MVGDLKTYSVAATRYIIDLEEVLDECNGKLAGLEEWHAKTRTERK